MPKNLKSKERLEMNYCIEGCGRKVSKLGCRCHFCASKRPHKFDCNCCICKAKKGESKGQNAPNYGKRRVTSSKIFLCKFGCNEKVSGKNRGCRSCSNKRIVKNPVNHWNYKNGRTDLRDRIRRLEEYSNWRTEIFKRDNYTCQECFVRGNDLEAHHIKEFVIILSEFLSIYSQFSPIEDKETLVRLAINYNDFWNIHNGKTLCKMCHNKTKKGNLFSNGEKRDSKDPMSKED